MTKSSVRSSSAIGALVERTTRFLMGLHLRRPLRRQLWRRESGLAGTRVCGLGLAQVDAHYRRAPAVPSGTRELAISRYELPNLGAVNLVIRGLLEPAPPRRCGWTRAKALGEWLRSRSTEVRIGW
jgi:hypothetical protein